MKKYIEKASNFSILYGLSIVLIYGLLLAEFVSTINVIIMRNVSLGSMYNFLMNASYFVTILSSVAVWLITSLLFHLTALLFNGKSLSFSCFIKLSSYPYIIPACTILIAIFLLEDIQLMEENIATLLPNDKNFIFILSIINWSFIPYYLILIAVVKYSYNLKWLYSILSVAVPVISIWGATRIFSLIL